MSLNKINHFRNSTQQILQILNLETQLKPDVKVSLNCKIILIIKMLDLPNRNQILDTK